MQLLSEDETNWNWIWTPPPRHAPLVPWDEVAVDLIGPWKLKVGMAEYEFNVLTYIDTVTNLIEIILIESKTSHHIAWKFKNCWLA